MAEVPHDLHAGGLGGTKHGQERRPIVVARDSLHPMPTDSVAGGPDSVLPELLVVLEGEKIMARRRKQVEPPTVPAAM